MERIYPLHSRVDTERISAKYKKGRLEIRIPDKATALRAFYAVLFFFLYGSRLEIGIPYNNKATALRALYAVLFTALLRLHAKALLRLY